MDQSLAQLILDISTICKHRNKALAHTDLSSVLQPDRLPPLTYDELEVLPVRRFSRSSAVIGISAPGSLCFESGALVAVSLQDLVTAQRIAGTELLLSSSCGPLNACQGFAGFRMCDYAPHDAVVSPLQRQVVLQSDIT